MDAIITKLIALAKRGDRVALKILFERLDGPLIAPSTTAIAINNQMTPPPDHSEPKLSRQKLRELLARLGFDDRPLIAPATDPS